MAGKTKKVLGGYDILLSNCSGLFQGPEWNQDLEYSLNLIILGS